jgi:uncharacterized protein YciI
MFIVELTYTTPLPEIDASMAAHVKFLKKLWFAKNLSRRQ